MVPESGSSAPKRPKRSRIPPPPVSPDAPLSPREQRFVSEYLIHENASEAAKAAGYSRGAGAATQGCRLLMRANIQRAIAEGNAIALARNGITADRVLEELRRIGFSDARDLFDAKDKLRRPSSWSVALRASVAAVELKSGKVAKVRFWNKGHALELLARRLGLVEARDDRPPVSTFKLPDDTPVVNVH